MIIFMMSALTVCIFAFNLLFRMKAILNFISSLAISFVSYFVVLLIIIDYHDKRITDVGVAAHYAGQAFEKTSVIFAVIFMAITLKSLGRLLTPSASSRWPR